MGIPFREFWLYEYRQVNMFMAEKKIRWLYICKYQTYKQQFSNLTYKWKGTGVSSKLNLKIKSMDSVGRFKRKVKNKRINEYE